MGGSVQDSVVVSRPRSGSVSIFEGLRSQVVCVRCGDPMPVAHVPARCPTCGGSLWMAYKSARPDRDGGGSDGGDDRPGAASCP
jgi:hypothetical protein